MFADAEYVGKAADRRSVSEVLVMYGGGCVPPFSIMQKCVTLSTTKAEYFAMADIIKLMLLFKRVRRFTLPQVGMPCILVIEDIQGAVNRIPSRDPALGTMTRGTISL